MRNFSNTNKKVLLYANDNAQVKIMNSIVDTSDQKDGIQLRLIKQIW